MTQVPFQDSLTQSLPTLLPLKLVPPQLRGEVVLPADLEAMLAEVRLHPATLVVAPAGYGKTTLLAQWASNLAHTGSAICWITLDAADNDPALQLAYLIRAFQQRFPNVGEQAWRILHSIANPQRDWAMVAGALCSDLQAKLLTPTFLFLDDLHSVLDGAITGQLLGYLLRAAPPNLHVVIASRRPVSTAPLPRLRAENALVEVMQQDLSLSESAAHMLLQRHGVEVTAEEMALLLTHTEGWALSLQLAARALVRQAPEQRIGFLRNLGVDQRELGLFDYLASEVLADLPTELLDFLALAALPQQFDAALLAKVLHLHNAPSLLGQAQQMGLPLTSIDEQGSLLRFHPLWRELLLRHAQTLLDAAAWVRYQRSFGQALEERGLFEAALQHYAAANDIGEIARALRERAWPLINTPQRDTIRGWLEQLPEATRNAEPELLHMWGWSQSALAPSAAADAISAAAERYRDQGLAQRELRALSDLAALLFWEDRPADFAAVCSRALQAANRTQDAWARGTALVCVVALRYNQGNYAAALRMARYATRHPRSPFWQWLLSLIVSDISIQQGHPAAALSAVDQALALPQVDREDRLRQVLLRQRALALHQHGHISEAADLALAAHAHMSEYYNDNTVGTSAASLALILLEQSRPDEAATFLAQARTAALRTGAATLLTRIQVLEVYALLQTGETDKAVIGAQEALRYLDDSGGANNLWLRVLLLLALGEGGAVAQAASLADDLVAQMQQWEDGLFRVIVELYRAALAQQQDNTTLAEQALCTGWGLAERKGFRYLPFLPTTVLQNSTLAALQRNLSPMATAGVLRRQLPDHATMLLINLLKDKQAATRSRAAELLGDLGAATAYSALRSLLKDRDNGVRSAASSALGRLVYRPPYQLRVRTLGAFNVWRGDEEVRDRDWRSIKARQLLQLMLVEHGRMLPRDRVMDMLWSDLEIDAAANNLRVTLSRLTKALEPERPEGAPAHYVIQQGDTYGFNVESDHQLDSADFTQAVTMGQRAEMVGDRVRAIKEYRHAIALYGGTFLPDSLYEDWTVVERERLALLFNKAAIRLGNLLLEDKLPHEAIGLAWRVIEYDQAQEEAYQLLMQAHIQQGERSTALRLYSRCVAALESELGVEPLPETVAIYEGLRGSEEESL